MSLPIRSLSLTLLSVTTIIVLGDYLYVDGGEVAQLYSGQNASATHPSYPMNGTISIPLKTSWTNAPPPSSNPQNPPRSSNSKAPGKFSTDGSGSGSWGEETPRGDAVVELTKAVRASQGSWAQSRDVGYFLGGYASEYTDTSVTGDTCLALPRLLSYNMVTGELANSSSEGLGPYGTLVGGAAEYLPFGPSGVLLFLGGQSPVATQNCAWTGTDFNNPTIYISVPRSGTRSRQQERGPPGASVSSKSRPPLFKQGTQKFYPHSTMERTVLTPPARVPSKMVVVPHGYCPPPKAHVVVFRGAPTGKHVDA
ncbi:hypothetical protein B0T26DRAFT_752818 [Lasiosphaeria miniovina]|uniref:Uncharacterized protein n=1 Tax=Lasiosphaeria miniovina TaxID=1954250 RepID=A0AA40ABC4_9PEZI|nr:uncharacterized protein B0T26DRAFT_752818 [Lasiosphaeria miniovina]KAK0712600.1 hypothetical protein B0T26DRAFT_752818 [Lasiosphaeria miniovina]